MSDPSLAFSLDLGALLERGVSPKELTRRLFYFNLDQTRASDPELAEMLRACAIPRRFDAEVIGVLRDAPDDHETNARLLAGLLPFSFVLARKDGGYVYHDNTRDMLLEDWQTADHRDRYDEINGRLAIFYQDQYKKAHQLERELGRMSDVIRRANPARYVQLVSIIETRIIAPLLEALYHEINRSAEDGYNLFTSYCEAYEANGRLTVCESLLRATRDYIERLPPDSGQEGWLNWLSYWMARLARGVRRHAEAEDVLRKLLSRIGPDTKLRLWTLGELGSTLHEQDKLVEAREIYEEELSLAIETREDPYNLPVSYNRVANVNWSLYEMDQAADKYRQAIQSAQEENNLRLEVYSRLDLSGALHNIGRWSDALDEAFEAVQLARTRLPRDRSVLHRAVAERLMSLVSRRDPRLLNSLFKEAMALVEAPESFQTLSFRNRQVDILQESGRLEQTEEFHADLRRDAGGYADTTFWTDLLFREAFMLSDRGRIAEAIERYDEVVRQFKEGRSTVWIRVAALSNRGLKQAERGRWREAESDLQAALEEWKAIGHKKLVALMQVFSANALRRQGRLVEAQELLDEARLHLTGGRPENLADYHQTQGDVYQAQSRWPEAREQYQQALTLNLSLDQFKQAAQNLGDLARAAAAQGQWAEAERHAAEAQANWRRLAEINRYRPSDVMGQADKKNAEGIQHFCANEGDADEGERRENLIRARDLFRAAGVLVPDHFWSHLNLAYACAELEEWAEAAEAVSTALDQGPEWMRSPVLYKRLAEYRQKHSEALQEEGDRHLKNGRPDEALERFTTALELAHEQFADNQKWRAELHSRMGYACFELNDADNAQSHFVSALRLYREGGAPDPGEALGAVCRSLIRDVGQYWELEDTWKAFENDPGTNEELQIGFAGARKSLANYLDELFRLAEQSGENIDRLPIVTPIVMEIGNGLIPEDTSENWSLFKTYIPEMRDRIKNEMGVQVAGVRVRGNNALAPNGYTFMLDENPLVSGSVQLSMAEPMSYVVNHLEAFLRRNLADFLGVQEVENLLKTWGQTERGKNLIKAALPDQPSRLRFARALRALVKESVPITAWEEILEAVRDIGLANDNVSEVVRAVRLRLKRMLPGNTTDARRLEFPSEWEGKMVTWLRRENGQEHFVPPPDETHNLLSAIGDLVDSGDFALVIKNSHLRSYVRRLIENRFPDLMTLSQEELLAHVDLPAAPPAQTEKQAEGASGDE